MNSNDDNIFSDVDESDITDLNSTEEIIDEKKLEQEQSKQNIKETIQTAEKLVGNYYGGSKGGEIVDAAHKAPIIGKNLNKTEENLSKALNKNPMARQMANQMANSGVNQALNQAMDMNEQNESGNLEAQKIAASGDTSVSSSNKVNNAQADPNLKKELSHIIAQKLLTKKLILITALVSLGLIIFVILFSVITDTISDDESEVNTSDQVAGLITGDLDFEDITSYLVYLGICESLSDEKEAQLACEKSDYGQFLLYFKNLYADYKQKEDKYGDPIKLDIPLLLETISYNRTDNTLRGVLNEENNKVINGTIAKNSIYTELDNLVEALVEEATEYGDLYECSGEKCLSCSVKKDEEYKTYYRISDDKYISYLKYGKVHENYSGKTKMYDVDIHPDSDSECIPEGREYNPPSDARYFNNIE